MKVYLNKHDKKGRVIGRKVVKAEFIQENRQTVLVRLPDGHVILRRKDRDVVMPSTVEV